MTSGNIPGPCSGQVTLGELTRSNERTVDELHYNSQDDRACQGWQDIEAGHQWADVVPHGGGEAAEQRSTGDVYPVIVGLLPGVPEEQVLRRRGQPGSSCSEMRLRCLVAVNNLTPEGVGLPISSTK